MNDEPSFGKIILWGLLSIIGVLVLWMVLASAIWGFGVATAGIYGRGEARKEIQSAPFRIQAYQYFFNQCSSIQGLEGQIDEQAKTLAQFAPGSREYTTYMTNVTSLKGARHMAIAKYNQDALKDYTEGQFRDEDLPYQLKDSDYPEKGGKTVCAVR